ncbi:MAG: DUF427 domain-containing protein [Chloroflexota bacterium]|nr:DUF427 domain-containing protein [Chloroflexota bacterium]
MTGLRAIESVWDYPRPPSMEPSDRRIRIVVDGTTIADTRRAIRVLETSHPPVWYIPAEDVRTDLLRPTKRQTACEFKGEARYFRVNAGGADRVDAAWTYPQPLPGYEAIRGYLAFYPGRVDEAWVDDERVMPQAGDFYGGWISSEVIGPFKGGPGTRGW